MPVGVFVLIEYCSANGRNCTYCHREVGQRPRRHPRCSALGLLACRPRHVQRGLQDDSRGLLRDVLLIEDQGGSPRRSAGTPAWHGRHELRQPCRSSSCGYVGVHGLLGLLRLLSHRGPLVVFAVHVRVKSPGFECYCTDFWGRQSTAPARTSRTSSSAARLWWVCSDSRVLRRAEQQDRAFVFLLLVIDQRQLLVSVGGFGVRLGGVSIPQTLVVGQDAFSAY